MESRWGGEGQFVEAQVTLFGKFGKHGLQVGVMQWSCKPKHISTATFQLPCLVG